ncbi:MAG TPA: hypothetical protein VGK73_01100 [Polyangiaceae bacterium]
MAELRESSLLFSLDSLLAEERERVENERRRAERARAEAEQRKAVEAARSAEEQARCAAEAHARAAREQELLREQEARLEGIRRGEIERVTAEAKLRSEIELDVRKSEHALRLEAARATQRARALKGALGAACLVVVLVAGGALALELGVRRPERVRLQASFDGALASERERTGHVRKLLEESERRARLLQRALEDVKPTSAPAAPSAHERTPPARPARQPARPGPRERRPCTGNPDDPLNPCL